jgi:hypothetical protein
MSVYLDAALAGDRLDMQVFELEGVVAVPMRGVWGVFVWWEKRMGL